MTKKLLTLALGLFCISSLLQADSLSIANNTGENIVIAKGQKQHPQGAPISITALDKDESVAINVDASEQQIVIVVGDNAAQAPEALAESDELTVEIVEEIVDDIDGGKKLQLQADGNTHTAPLKGFIESEIAITGSEHE